VMKIESGQTTESKHQWKIVRRDSCADVAGEIVSADEQTGECVVQIAGEEKPRSLSFGPDGIRLVGRRR
jgi:hypothetical protein